MAKKEKKEKITYIDDGRTIADMSGVQDNRKWMREGTHSSPKEIWKTYWAATKLMFRPLLVVAGGLILIYAILYILFSVL